LAQSAKKSPPVFDDIFGLVQSLLGGSHATPSPTASARSGERLALMRSFLKRLDTELPQVIAEALEEAARVINADVAAIFEVQGDELQCVYCTDPSLLGERVAVNDEQVAAREHGSSALRNAMGVADALCANFRAAEREWVLFFGERTARLDRTLFDTENVTLLDVFAQLLRQQHQGAYARSQVDHVTGLPDRWATMNRLGETMQAAKRNNTHAALLFIDLNGFKGVNDSFGHGHGDEVLRAIATTLRDVLRANEFVGRIGGDEFAVILPVVRNSDEATSAARRLAEGVRDLAIVHAAGSVSLSVGIAYYPEHASSVDEWLHHADLAMYQAKRQGASFCVFAPGESSADFHTPAQIEDPYAREFLLCFQPIFEVESGTVVGAEALLRSLHPQEGVQSAHMTMEAARSRRSLEHLDAWVTRRALAYAAEWRTQGISRIHVNIGHASEDILSNVLRAVDTSGCDASMLALELDWSRFAQDAEPYATFAEAAERCGLYVGLDNFGETPLELSLLESLAVRFIKPSKSMLPSGGARGKSMEAMVALSRVYGWDVIAMRVATSDDRTAIRHAGVKYMQGFAVAQPMTAIDFNQWIESSPRIALVS
jgi:diguanylate cyclase (GGDEF)-like protein